MPLNFSRISILTSWESRQAQESVTQDEDQSNATTVKLWATNHFPGLQSRCVESAAMKDITTANVSKLSQNDSAASPSPSPTSSFPKPRGCPSNMLEETQSRKPSKYVCGGDGLDGEGSFLLQGLQRGPR